MSLLEYVKNDDVNILTDLLNNYKKKSDDIELIQLLEFMTEKMTSLLKENKKLSNNSAKKKDAVQKTSFTIKTFKITVDKLYLIIDKNEALEYVFKKESLTKCYEIINSGRIHKSDIGTIFNKVTI